MNHCGNPICDICEPIERFQQPARAIYYWPCYRDSEDAVRSPSDRKYALLKDAETARDFYALTYPGLKFFVATLSVPVSPKEAGIACASCGSTAMIGRFYDKTLCGPCYNSRKEASRA